MDAQRGTFSKQTVIIAENAENAIIEHNTITAHGQPVTAVYTDGSGVIGRVGAAAVCPKHQEARSAYMGEQSEATVYVAELQGILLALVIPITLGCDNWPVSADPTSMWGFFPFYCANYLFLIYSCGSSAVIVIATCT